MDISLMAICIACLFLVRAGQMLFHAGVSRSKNATSAIARSLCDLMVSTLAFWGIGAAILLQNHNGYLSLEYRLLFGENVAVLSYLALALIACGQVGIAMAERSRFVVIWPVSLLMAAIIVPVVGHWSWIGVLRARGAIDVGGAMPLHLAAAVVALVAARAVGPRTGKYNRDGSCNAIPGHSLVMMGVGLAVMMAGWLLYFALVSWMWPDVLVWRSVFGGMIAAAVGGCGAMVFGWRRFGKVDVPLTILGIISGMAGVSAGVGLLHGWAAAVLGLVAGIVGPWFALWIDVRWRIDEVSGLAGALGAAAIISLVGSPLLVDGTAGQRLVSLAINLGGAAATILLCAMFSLSLFAMLKRLTRIRATDADEYDGLDLAEHDINAYPDFQQTMIKSQHLRQ